MEREEIAAGRAVLWCGDCLDVLRALPASSVDSLVTDPPAGIAFMGKEWDRDKGGRDQWIAWMAEVARECLRVIRPGGHALVWALPRTSHWTATAWEDAGWEVREKIAHVFGSGFPKSLDVSKAIDKAAGVEREVVGYDAARARPNRLYEGGAIGNIGGTGKVSDRTDNGATITAPATEAAHQWAGWGTALKPAMEDWWLFRAPLAERTVAANVLAHGVGGINVDGCRVGTSKEVPGSMPKNRDGHGTFGAFGVHEGGPGQDPGVGRWPANLILGHHPDCRQVGTARVKGCGVGSRKGVTGADNAGQSGAAYGAESRPAGTEMICYADADGRETVAAWACHPDCPTRCFPETKSGALNRANITAANGIYGAAPKQRTGEYAPDSGSAARFFQQCTDDDPEDAATRLIYVPKASRSDRNEGCEGLSKEDGVRAGNSHPT